MQSVHLTAAPYSTKCYDCPGPVQRIPRHSYPKLRQQPRQPSHVTRRVARQQLLSQWNDGPVPEPNPSWLYGKPPNRPSVLPLPNCLERPRKWPARGWLGAKDSRHHKYLLCSDRDLQYAYSRDSAGVVWLLQQFECRLEGGYQKELLVPRQKYRICS